MQMWVVAAGLGLRPRRPPRVVMERSRANHSVIGTGKAKATCLKSRSCPNGYFLHISAQAFPSQTSPLFPGHSSPVHHCVVFLVLGRYNDEKKLPDFKQSAQHHTRWIQIWKVCPRRGGLMGPHSQATSTTRFPPQPLPHLPHILAAHE
ncbi:uncharacterized protein LOC144312246 isoform X2 [Canis aureus]